MGSPITLSGFNNIDFNVVLDAIMRQERVPVTQLEGQQRTFEGQKTAFGTLAGKLAALATAARTLGQPASFEGRKTTISDSTALSTSGGSATPLGAYEVLVTQLARAQVTTTTSTHAHKDTTVVASGGTLTIGGVDVVVSGDVTLEGLAAAINDTEGVGATASVVRNGTNYQLVLTGQATGQANGFTIANGLTGGSGLAFAATNAQDASDATISVNSVQATSDTNTFDGVIPGTTLTVFKQNATTPVTVLVAADSTATREAVDAFVSAYNDLSTHLASEVGTGALARDPLVRNLRVGLSTILTGQYAVSGNYSTLAEVGLEFTRTGQLSLNASLFDSALSSDKASLASLFTGATGAFAAFETAVEQYTDAGGLIPNAQSRIDTQLQQIGKRISDLEARLDIRRRALQEEFIAADLAIAQLNQQMGQLNNVSGGYRLF
jgi:flagellar hook-associated protein 2